MTFQAIQAQLQSLETRLIEANTYKNVLALKDEIASLIISFNNIERTSCSQAPEAMLAVKTNIKNLSESYRAKIQNLRPRVPQVMNTLFKKDLMREIAGIPYQFFHSPTNYHLELNPDHELFSSELLRAQPDEEIVSRRSPIVYPPLASELASDSEEETQGQVKADYQEVPKRKIENEPEPYVCIMDENIGCYYAWGPECEFDVYSRYLLSTVRPEYPLETEHYQQPIMPPEPKEDTTSDYKEVTFRKPRNQSEPYIASIPSSDYSFSRFQKH